LKYRLGQVDQELSRQSNAAHTVTNMPTEEWIKTLEDGRLVKFTNQTLMDVGAFITAQIEKNEIVYSIVLDDVKKPMSRREVENRFKAELAKT
jgi:hypothetical protein